MLAHTNRLDIKPWIKNPNIKAVLSAITKNGKEARFIGGCVRDRLLKKKINDIDIATQELPQNIISLLKDAGIKAVPTGLKHGTIMAVINNKTFEITTLRRDVQTDGRHAEVQFTENWKHDAARRDFTLNAISIDLEGKIFDYFNGRYDLDKKIIRFVGHAPNRINEDHLRILRYFRFIATMGLNIGDPKELDACIDQAGKLNGLSGERIRSELFKILSSKMEKSILQIMYEKGILGIILPHATSPERLMELARLETSTLNIKALRPDPIRRLATLVKTDVSGIDEITNALKLSKIEHKQLINIKKNTNAIYWNMTHNRLQRAIFKLGNKTVIDLALHNWADTIISSSKYTLELEDGWMQIIAAAEEQQDRELILPIKGQDAVDLGIPPSCKISQLLKQVEDWWLQNGCMADRKACLRKLKFLAGLPSYAMDKSKIQEN
jgi:poly(A) polymerase